jgi:hypothetical protein
MTPTYKSEPIVVVPFPPDWTVGPRLRIKHSTGVFEALDLSEERHRRFPRPLYGISFEASVLTSKEQGALRKLFELSKEKPVGVPLWTEAVRLTAGVAAGSTNLPVTSTAVTLFQVFNYAIIWSDWATWEIVELDAVAANALTAADPTVSAFASGSLVLPFVIGFAKRPEFTGLSAESSSVPIEFEEVFHRDLNQKGTLDA